MKKFLQNVVLFLGIISVLIIAYCYLSTYTSTKYYGPNTAQQIKTSFENAVKEDYDCYILGNSRIYRGINPDRLEKVHAYNFAHDNDTYNQMYYKLVYLLKNNSNIDTVILGTDYFQFSFFSNTRNYIYIISCLEKIMSKIMLIEEKMIMWNLLVIIGRIRERIFLPVLSF